MSKQNSTTAQIIEQLQAGWCSLTYIKDDGSSSGQRKGTLSQSMIPENKRSSADPNANASSSGNITYFDEGANEYRTFAMDRLQSSETISA